MQTMGVKWVEDTEDFLERIGHLAKPEDRQRLEEEVRAGCVLLCPWVCLWDIRRPTWHIKRLLRYRL